MTLKRLCSQSFLFSLHLPYLQACNVIIRESRKKRKEEKRREREGKGKEKKGKERKGKERKEKQNQGLKPSVSLHHQSRTQNHSYLHSDTASFLKHQHGNSDSDDLIHSSIHSHIQSLNPLIYPRAMTDGDRLIGPSREIGSVF